MNLDALRIEGSTLAGSLVVWAMVAAFALVMIRAAWRNLAPWLAALRIAAEERGNG